jgi:hypothetical protein
MFRQSFCSMVLISCSRFMDDSSGLAEIKMTVRNVVDLWLLPIYFHLLPSLPPPSAPSLVSRHRTAVAPHFRSLNDAGYVS